MSDLANPISDNIYESCYEHYIWKARPYFTSLPALIQTLWPILYTKAQQKQALTEQFGNSRYTFIGYSYKQLLLARISFMTNQATDRLKSVIAHIFV